MKRISLSSSLKKLLLIRRRSSVGTVHSDDDDFNISELCHPALMSRPTTSAMVRQDTAMNEEAQKKFDQAEKLMKRRQLESSKVLFNEALRKWLMLYGANSKQVLRCHSRLVDLACLQRDFKKADHHIAACQRIRRANEEDYMSVSRALTREMQLREKGL